AKPLSWIGSVYIPADVLMADAACHPVVIEPDAFCHGEPLEPLSISPQHRVLVKSWQAELVCGEPDVLIAAKHLVDLGLARQASPREMAGGVRYWHLLFDQHEIVVSNGLPTESFRPGPEAVKALDHATAAELRKFFPDIDVHMVGLVSARYLATRNEARLILNRH
ncbi:MAG: Hint domain-containing protein, partial [Boseongicola sp.]